MTIAIEFENISKQYRLGLVSTGTLSHDLNRFWQTKVLRREDRPHYRLHPRTGPHREFLLQAIKILQ